MLAGRIARVVHVASGAAGAGRTTLVSNLAVALAAMAHEVIVIDENNRLGNVCDAFGLRPRFELAHALSGDRPLADVVLHGPQGVRVLPAARGRAMLEEGRAAAPIRAALARVLQSADFILVDCARGLPASRALPFSGPSEVIIPAAADAAAITDTYAWIKRMAALDCDFEAQLVIGRAASAAQACSVHANLAAVARQHLGLALPLLGAVRRDARVAESARRGQALCAAYPRAEAAGDFRAIARSLESKCKAPAATRADAGNRLAA